jgi:hypothetical protein
MSRPRSRWSSLALLSIGGCSILERADTIGDAPTASPLGLVSTEDEADPKAGAVEALAQDARRREARFHDAAAPGTYLEWSRPEQLDIESGVYSPDELYQLGGQLFLHDFKVAEGLGGADAPYPRRLQFGSRGGPEATSCRACHWRGGLAGAGDTSDNVYFDSNGSVPSTGLERNPIALVGAGYVELVAREMTAELAGRIETGLVQARTSRRDERVILETKGVDFGFAMAKPDGSVDTAQRIGIDADLVVRPFGHKGNVRTLREAVEDALRLHHGMQSDFLVERDGQASERMGPFGGDDPDGDGVVSEINEGQVTALTLFAAMQAVPVVEMPPVHIASASAWATGRATFERIGCADCHTPTLPLSDTHYRLESREGGGDVVVDLARSGAMPRLMRSGAGGSYSLELYSDLKRHDLGSDLAERRDASGVPSSSFLTRPLWGIARSRPYLHDGRAPTLHDAILAHGGEAAESRERYIELGELGQSPVRIFLISLTRHPAYVAH